MPQVYELLLQMQRKFARREHFPESCERTPCNLLLHLQQKLHGVFGARVGEAFRL